MFDNKSASCETEQIHTPDSIVPHGAMLVVDCGTLEILQAAGDVRTLLGCDVDRLLGRPLTDILTGPQIEALAPLRAGFKTQQARHVLDPILRIVPACPADASVHHSDGMLVIEWEPVDGAELHAAHPLASVEAMLKGINNADSLQSFCQAAADTLRNTLRYDRVMVYRFRPDESGRVIAESRAEDLQPFLHLHFPASDIPSQARRLYALNWIRHITQVDYEAAPLQPSINPLTGRSLDMSFATLRNVSPVHRAYLRNMGVEASMSISIIVGGRLWGLIACHHMTPRRLPRHLRAICELFGSLFSLQLEVRERTEALAARLAGREILRRLAADLPAEHDLSGRLVAQQSLLLDMMNVGVPASHFAATTGVAIRVGGKLAAYGQTPPMAMIRKLTDWAAGQLNGSGMLATHHLGSLWPPAAAQAGVAAGLMAISVTPDPADMVLWFRPEIVDTIHWGGDPGNMDAVERDDRPLSPRRSFAAWKDMVQGQAAWWEQPETDMAKDLRAMLLDIPRRRQTGTAHVHAQLQQQEAHLLAAFDARIEHTHAIVQSLTSRSDREAYQISDFVAALEQRLRAMMRSSTVMTSKIHGMIPLPALLREEIEAHAAWRGRISLNGPEVSVGLKGAVAVAMAVHNLIRETLQIDGPTADGSTEDGQTADGSTVDGPRTEITWDVSPVPGLTLHWRETTEQTAGPSGRKASVNPIAHVSALLPQARCIQRDGHGWDIILPADVMAPAEGLAGAPQAAGH